MIDLNALPASVKKGFLSLWIGWLVHLCLVFILFGDDQKILMQQIAIAAFVFYFVCVKLRNWARKLCMMGNIIAIVYFGFFAIIMFKNGNMLEGTLFSINIGIFLFSTWYLFCRETAEFFKQQMENGEGSSGGN